MKKMTQLSLAAILTLSATGSFAAGFQLAEISTSGLGSSFSGNAAIAEDASIVATNPALMTEFTRPEISAGGIYVGAKVDINGNLSGRNASNKNIVPNAIIPNLYFVSPVNERFSIGAGINVNYGLKTQFEENYTAGWLGGMTELKAINYNLSGAAKLGHGFSFGFGVNVVHAEAELDRYAGVLPEMLANGLLQKKPMLEQALRNPALPASKRAELQATLNKINAVAPMLPMIAGIPASTKIKHLEGNEWGYGWNAGLTYSINENHRFGLAYHSGIKLDFKGKFSNELSIALGSLLPENLQPATGGKNVPAKLSVTLPAFWELSAYHKLTDQLALHYSWKHTKWSVFKRLLATDNNNKDLLRREEKFSDNNRYAIGLTYKAMEKLTLRAGIAYEQSASRKIPSISIPDTNRTWYSIGATYKFTPNLSTDIGYAYVYGHKNNFSEGTGAGSLDVKSRAHVNLFGLNVNYKF
ncbi:MULTISPECIES: porin [Pasteurellaceae]|uniref:Porin n=1 Tax=Pasteurella atlantica TaxID=2827233 RepID=A0AAW8CFN1_9PAST|nr:porin [Pasteurella atlantica]MBR0572782.1 porin [Pasteurella atlantica]MDP8038710.1 porin [Pasteurella atlantica]MDP8040802.1 porin [Pasteurella atlantica]MDP8043025.1 porin [Pasteurella atlantica]MDP8045111.1 porin [Pasteurella atlantica]